jgi:hypothetical protein
MRKIQLTKHEWFDALKVPSPHRNKKKYFRKEKYKKMATLLVATIVFCIFGHINN